MHASPALRCTTVCASTPCCRHAPTPREEIWLFEAVAKLVALLVEDLRLRMCGKPMHFDDMAFLLVQLRSPLSSIDGMLLRDSMIATHLQGLGDIFLKPLSFTVCSAQLLNYRLCLLLPCMSRRVAQFAKMS